MYQVRWLLIPVLAICLASCDWWTEEKKERHPPDPFFWPYELWMPEPYPKFSIWFKKERIELHRKRNEDLVRQCESVISHENKTVEIDRRLIYPCSGYGPSRGVDAKYRIFQKNGRLSLGMVIGVTPVSANFFEMKSEDLSKERSEELLRQAQACIPQIRATFEQYRLNFDLEIIPFVWDDNLFELNGRSQYDHTVYLIDSHGRSNTNWWYAEKLDFCGTLIHELGHQFGLDDEYSEPGACPEREFISHEVFPASIMGGDINEEHGYTKDFFPRHLATILEPICPGIKEMVDPTEITAENVLSEHGLTYEKYRKIWIEANGPDSDFYLSEKYDWIR